MQDYLRISDLVPCNSSPLRTGDVSTGEGLPLNLPKSEFVCQIWKETHCALNSSFVLYVSVQDPARKHEISEALWSQLVGQPQQKRLWVSVATTLCPPCVPSLGVGLGE